VRNLYPNESQTNLHPEKDLSLRLSADAKTFIAGIGLLPKTKNGSGQGYN